MLSGFGLSKNAVANGFLFQFVRGDPAEHPEQRIQYSGLIATINEHTNVIRLWAFQECHCKRLSISICSGDPAEHPEQQNNAHSFWRMSIIAWYHVYGLRQLYNILLAGIANSHPGGAGFLNPALVIFFYKAVATICWAVIQPLHQAC